MPRVGKPEPGEWHLIDNDVVVVSRAKKRNGERARYRWIVIDPPLLVRVWAAPRTRQPTYGLSHDKHPEAHEPTCEITCRGEIGEAVQLDQHVFRDAVYSCVEPDETWPDVIDHCKVARPRRPSERRRRHR